MNMHFNHPPKHEVETAKERLRSYVQAHLPEGTESDDKREALWPITKSDDLLPITGVNYSETQDDEDSERRLFCLELKAPEEFATMLYDEGEDWLILQSSTMPGDGIFMTPEGGDITDTTVVDRVIDKLTQYELEGKLLPPGN